MTIIYKRAYYSLYYIERKKLIYLKTILYKSIYIIIINE